MSRLNSIWVLFLIALPSAYAVPKKAPKSQILLVVDPKQSIVSKKGEEQKELQGSYEEMLEELRKLYKKPSSHI